MKLQRHCGVTLEENHLMINHLIWIPGCWAYMPAALVDLIEYGDHDEVLEKVFTRNALSEFRDNRDRHGFSDFEICDNGKVGYLACVSTPTPENVTMEDDEIRLGTYTWGLQHFQWFYGMELDDIISQAVAWKTRLYEKAWERSKK